MNEHSSVTVSEWLADSEATLKKAGIESARLDALVLLSDTLQKDKSWLLAYPDNILQGSELKILNTFITQRVTHVPLAYIRGHVEFYGKNFIVSPAVLVPRPESEAFLELLTAADSDTYSSIIDIGTGSGALAVSAALLCPTRSVYATDCSEAALAVAKENALKHKVVVHFAIGNLLEPLTDVTVANAILLCNLPYVPANFPVNKATTHEPSVALYSGTDGLDHYKELFSQISVRTSKPRYILTESLLSQHSAVQSIALNSGYRLLLSRGLVQEFMLTYA